MKNGHFYFFLIKDLLPLILGSEKEKEVLNKAYKYSNGKKVEALEKYMDTQITKDVTFSYESHVADNGDITVKMGAHNTSSEERTCPLHVATRACYYTGVKGEELANEKLNMKLKPGESKFLIPYIS